MPYSSPFAPALQRYEDEMPECLRDQYLGGDFEVVLGGIMHSVWHRPWWLYPGLWILARGNILFPETGNEIATTLHIRSAKDELGRPLQIWERTFHFPGRMRKFCSTMLYEPGTDCVVELEGPGHLLQEYTKVTFESPGSVRIVTVKSQLKLGRWKISLPKLIWFRGDVVQEYDPACDSTSVELVVTSPLLGKVFGYRGTFKSTRRDG